MKAVVFEAYGPPEVLKVVEIEKPAHKGDEVLVKVLATSVNLAEWYGMTGLFLAALETDLPTPKTPDWPRILRVWWSSGQKRLGFQAWR